MKKILVNKLIIWFFDNFANRAEYKTYLGHGDFDIERGWMFKGKFISAERYL